MIKRKAAIDTCVCRFGVVVVSLHFAWVMPRSVTVGWMISLLIPSLCHRSLKFSLELCSWQFILFLTFFPCGVIIFYEAESFNNAMSPTSRDVYHYVIRLFFFSFWPKWWFS